MRTAIGSLRNPEIAEHSARFFKSGNQDQKDRVFSLCMQHYKTMPRTMLRCAIEKFPEGRCKAYLNGMV